MVYPESKSDQLVKTLRYDVDDNYIPTLGMQIAAGRNFSREYGTDSTGLIINEQAAKAFGWNDTEAIGRKLTYPDNDGKRISFHVVGVVKDFHFKSLHEKISPLVMVLSKNFDNIIVKTKTKDLAGLITTMKKVWQPLADAPFTYSFLDERFNNTYKEEQKTGLILGIFAGVTIFVACLGLFGLATFTAEQRTKEIGVRKVLGATVSGIVALLSKDFLKLVFIAFLIASPIAWYMMNKWLQDFEYKEKISPWVFVSAAVLSILLTIITVSFRAVQAAMVNPVESLRSE